MNSTQTTWKETTLGEVAKNSSRSFDFSNYEEVVFVNTGDVLEGKFLHSKRSIKSILPGQAKKKIEKGDILFSEIRPANKRYAKVDFDPEGYVVSTKFMVIEHNEKIDFDFLYKVLTSKRTLQEFQVIAESRSGTFPQITFDAIAHFPILLPPLPEQRAIAGVLGSLDDKIELLREQNKTLEETARTIFREWFGKYSPDRPEELPDGWRVGRLSDIADFLNGLALQKFPPKNDGNDLPVVKIREMKSGITGQTGFASDEVDEKYIVKNGDILFSWSGSLEVVIWKHGEGALNQHSFKVTSKKYPKWFYYFWVLHHLKEFQNVAANKATTMGHINRHHLDEALVLIPEEKTMNKIGSILAPVLEKFESNNSQIQTLSTLRDTLLPKLMRGEVRVKF